MIIPPLGGLAGLAGQALAPPNGIIEVERQSAMGSIYPGGDHVSQAMAAQQQALSQAALYGRGAVKVEAVDLKPLTFIEELQKEVDDWLKDTI